MGWFGRKKAEEAQPAEKDAQREMPQHEGLSAAPKNETPDASGEVPAADGVATSTADFPLPAIFDFGGSAVAAGVQMKGLCSVKEPDQIHACLWRVDPVAPDTPKSESKYQILF